MKQPIPQRLVTILVLCLCIVANVIFQIASLRVDLSNGKAFSISEASKKVIAKLRKPVAITFFSSQNLPSELKSTRQEVRDFLKEYSKQAGGKKIIYTIKDPSTDVNVQTELMNFNIPALQFSQQEQDRFAMQTGYFGIGISYDGKVASIPQVTDISDLEYNLTTALYKLDVATVPRVGVMGEDGLAQLQTLGQATQSQFTVEEVVSPSNDLAAVMVFSNATKEYTDEEVFSLRKYVNDGGSVIFFVDGVSVQESLTTSDSTHNLFDLLKSFGVKLEKDLILSQASELVSFGQSEESLQTVLPYPYWIKTNEFAKNSLFSNVNVLVFPWTSAAVPSSKLAGTLVSSEAQSWEQTKDFVLNPQAIAMTEKPKEKSYPLIVEGRYGKGRFLVVPSSRFVLDGFLSRTSDNLELIVNVLSEYVSDGAFSGIRKRSVEYYPLPQLQENLKNAIKYSQIFGAPALFALFGLYHLLKRNKKSLS